MAKAVDPDKMSRRQQFVETFRMTRRADPSVTWRMLLAFVLAGGVAFAVFYLLPGDGVLSWIITVLSTVMFAILGALFVFGRRAQSAAYAQMEGQPGAAAAALRMLKRGWHSEPVVAFTKQQDVVHRLVGPPGVVLIGEGNPNRLRPLLASERRKHERVVSETPVHELICGNGEGQVPLSKLVRHVQKMGRSVKPADMTDILNRLKALDAHRPTLPLPKGPVPTSMKGMRQNMRGR